MRYGKDAPYVWRRPPPDVLLAWCKAHEKHFFGNPNMSLNPLLDVYEAFDSFGLPLYISEITIPGSGDNGTVIQAEVLANLYKLWFSVKGMAGITWWNLGDKTAYGTEDRAMGGLLDANMDPKPAYEALNKLINHEWKTKFKGETDAEGQCAFRGFGGIYEVRATLPGGTTRSERMTLKCGGQNALTIKPEQGRTCERKRPTTTKAITFGEA